MDALYYATPVIMPFDGEDGSTEFTNYGIAGRSPFTPFGGVALSTSQSKFGGASCYFNGTDAKLQASAAILISGDFTIEGWFYPTAALSSYMTCISNAGAKGLFIHGGKAVWYSGGDYCTSAELPLNAWSHLAASRSGDTLRLFVNGVASDTTLASSEDISIITIGGHHSSEFMNGYIDDVRITQGVARYTANFSPPAALDIETPTIPVHASVSAFALMQIGSVPAAKYKNAPLPRQLQDVYFGGKGRIYGTTKVKGTPDYAVRRRVRLIREVDGMVVREAWSDAVTGAYSFDNISTQYKYTVLSYDYEHNFRAVVADNLTPEIMP